MNETDLRKCCNIRIKKLCDAFRLNLQREAKNLLNSGGVNVTDYGNDYMLPKVLVHAAIQNLRYELRPLDSKAREDAKNLEHF